MIKAVHRNDWRPAFPIVAVQHSGHLGSKLRRRDRSKDGSPRRVSPVPMHPGEGPVIESRAGTRSRRRAVKERLDHALYTGLNDKRSGAISSFSDRTSRR